MAETQVSKTQQALYNFFFRMAAEGLLLFGPDGLCIEINPAAAAMLQIVPAEVVGKAARDVFAKIPNLVRLLRPNGPKTMDIPLPRERIAQGIGQDMPDGGRAVLLADVTEQRRIESRREALVKAVAHDLRNPLNAISGYADLVAKFGDVTEKQQRFLQRIQQTSTKLHEVAASLVDLAWIEAGMPLEYGPFDLEALIREVIQLQTSKARQKKMKLVISTQDTFPPVMGDATRIKQALLHLVENAILYSPSESNVVIHAWQQNVQELRCSVADRGIGIAEGELDLIWDRMWRSSDERVQAIPGGGIGLKYTRTIIERHGGEIWVESQLNEGTVFTFRLPLLSNS